MRITAAVLEERDAPFCVEEMAAWCSGTTRIVAVDRHAHRLALARELGATGAIDATETDPVAAVHELLGGPADFSLECTGVVSVVRQAVDSVGMLGTCGLIGGAHVPARAGQRGARRVYAGDVLKPVLRMP